MDIKPKNKDFVGLDEEETLIDAAVLEENTDRLVEKITSSINKINEKTSAQK